MIYLIFFLSGFSALIYEIAWLRLLALTLGSTQQATACVLAVFLGGMALGSASIGRFVDRQERNHLFTYGLLELGVALIAPVASVCIVVSPGVFAQIYGSFVPAGFALGTLRLAVSGLVLLIPTALMGATLPVLAKCLSTFQVSIAREFGLLYALNTIGASLGSVFACFVGFSYLGIANTIVLAAGINLVVGLIACTISRAPTGDIRQYCPPITELDQPIKQSHLMFLCALAFLSGFATVSYEVIWTRLLCFYNVSTTYAFSLMLSNFLLGLGLGSLIYRQLYKRSGSLGQRLTNLGLAQYAAALACAGSVMLIPLSGLMFRSQTLGLAQADPLTRDVLILAVNSLLFILLPATILGIVFPSICGIASARGNVGSSIGLVYGTNTLGCVAGALVVGLGLQPSVGSFVSFQWTVLITTLTGCLAMASGIYFQHENAVRPASYKRGFQCIAGVVIPFSLAMSFAWVAKDPLLVALSEMKMPRVLDLGEDTTGIVMVLDCPGYKELRTNSAAVSSTRLAAKRYMRLLGHLPVLLHNRPSNSLVICFGTGITAGAIAIHPLVKQLDIVELSPLVLKYANNFSDSNENVLSNPKVSQFVDDGRNFLLCSKAKYDVISFEPPPPTEVGVVNLYSREFYALAKQRLNSEGIICQWVPMYLTSKSIWKMMVQAAREVFPYVSVWVPNNGEAMLIGSMNPIKIDLLKMQRRIEESPAVKASLEEVGLDDVYAILSTYLIGGGELNKYLAGSEPVTDNHPVVEFFLLYNNQHLYPWELETGQPGVSPGDVLCRQFGCAVSALQLELLNKHFMALHYFRLESKAAESGASVNKLNEYVDEILKLVPGNAFFQYARHDHSAQG